MDSPVLSLMDARNGLPAILREVTDGQPRLVGPRRVAYAAITTPHQALPADALTGLVAAAGETIGFYLAQAPDLDQVLEAMGTDEAVYPALPERIMPVLWHLWQTDTEGQTLRALVDAIRVSFAAQPGPCQEDPRAGQLVAATVAANLAVIEDELADRLRGNDAIARAVPRPRGQNAATRR